MLAGLFVPIPIRTVIWTAALLWMGVACILNGKRCGRTHCRLKKFPDMEYDDAMRLSPFSFCEILWEFTKRGEFEYACLIPGHREAGMHGKVMVK